MLSLYGAKDSKPIPPVNFSEFAGGSVVCVMGILMAVINRFKTGKGQVIDANITEGVSYIGSWLMSTQNNEMVWGNPKGQNLSVNLLKCNVIFQYYNFELLLDWTEECISTMYTKPKMVSGWLSVP